MLSVPLNMEHLSFDSIEKMINETKEISKKSVPKLPTFPQLTIKLDSLFVFFHNIQRFYRKCLKNVLITAQKITKC